MTGTNAFTAADLVAYISETWTPITLEEYFAKGVAGNFFTDLSPWASEGSDIFHVPDVFTNAHTVSTQSTEGTELTLNSPTSVDVTVTVDTHDYIALLMGDLTRNQIAKNVYDISAVYARKAGGSLMENFEDALFALWSGLSTNSVGDTATVLADAEIRQSVEKLATADFPLDECAWFIHPYVFWNQLLSVQKYYDASQFGKASATAGGTLGAGNAMTAMQGQLYGIPLYTSSRVVSGLQTYRNLLAHKTAFGFARQTPGGGAIRVQAQNWLANLGVLTVFDSIYGVAELRDAAAVVVNASTSFIGS
jgi:hypothetical protein